MMNPKDQSTASPLDLSKWRRAPLILVAVGLLISLPSAFIWTKEFAYAYLLAFMFFLSLCLGALFLVIVHHLFDAGWSVPIRRFCEHIATLLCPCMLLLFIPIALGAKLIYPWMTEDPLKDHSLHAK